MSVIISGIEPHSPAARLGIRAGHTLVSIDGHPIRDVLDYRFYLTNTRIALELADEQDRPYRLDVKKGEYDDLGLLFDSYLMDDQRSCRNKCVFCFIDQMPPGLRETLYFKDDDARMGFLFGNYITLTNLEEEDIRRIIEMRISPVNISVHTTDPELRMKMMKNPRAGEVLRWLPELAEAGIRLNAQIVLCPGYNDGEALKRSLTDLCALAPALQSLSVVPVGLTKWREGLAALRPFTGEEAAAVIDIIEAFGDRMLEEHGERIAYPSDEWFLLSGRPVPTAAYYGEFHQLENGVGMLALLAQEFRDALELEPPHAVDRAVTLATGVAAAPLLGRLCKQAEKRFPGLHTDVKVIDNDYLGHTITVAGLLCGCDLLAQLAGAVVGGELLLPASMLRHERDLFLDGVHVDELAEGLGCRITLVEQDGFALLDALLGIAD